MNRIRRALWLSWQEAAYCATYGGTRTAGRVRIAWELFVRWPLIWAGSMCRRLVCWKRGHDWEDEGHAGPDSGCIQMVCHRCGYSAPTHWLY